MLFNSVPGKKSTLDRIFYVQCPKCGYKEWWRLVDWLYMARAKGNIEDINYPKEWQKGRLMLIDFLRMGLEKENGNYKYSLVQCCKKFGIPEK